MKIAVAMSLVRASDKAQVIRGIEDEYKAHYKAAYEEQFQAKLQQLHAKLPEPKTGFFWQAVHRTFDGFPHLDMKLATEPAPGAQIGPCELEAVIGRGLYGTCYAATNTRTGQPEALKVVDKDRFKEVETVAALWREINYLGKLDHENVVRLMGSLQSPRHVFVRMELAGRCSLFRAMRANGGCLAPKEAQDYFAQISSAVAHCHSRNVAHRDLKPENVALADDRTQVKLVDFGTATSCQKRRTEIVGTMPFMAPEVLSVSQDAPYWPGGADVWSCAVLLLEMLCGIGMMSSVVGWGRSAEPGAERRAELEAMFAEHPEAISEQVKMQLGHEDLGLRSLLSGMLKVDPEHRWSAAQVERAASLSARRS